MKSIKPLLLGITFFACHAVSGQERTKDRADLWNVSERNQSTLLSHLRPVLKASGGSGRLYVQSKCVWDSEDLLFFPRIEVIAETKGKVGVDAMRDVLAKNKNVTVAERRPGLIGIWIGRVNNDLLSTRIHVVKLEPLERYNCLRALVAIIETKEVQTKMRELRMEIPPIVQSNPLVEPDPKLRHLPASITNVTMDEALDRVAEVFGGVVIYEECAGEKRTRLFSVDFKPITGPFFK